MVGVREVLFKEPVLDGRKRYRASDQAPFSLDCRGRASYYCQLGDRLMLKQLPRSESKTYLIGSGNDLKAEYGIPAQLKEVVMDAHRFDTEDTGPDLSQHLLCRSTGGHEDRV